ncbi:hypothetical protein FKM82_011957 [Ascaphus truei]
MAKVGIEQTKTYWIIKWQVLFYILFSWLCREVSSQLVYSIFEEISKDSNIGNIANDLGLNIKELSFRKIRIVSRLSEKYFNVNREDGNLYITGRIDRETLCGTAATCFLTFDAVVENPLNVYHVKVEIQDINDNPPRFSQETFQVDIIESTSPGARIALHSARDLDVGINSLQNYKLSSNQHFTLGKKTSSDGSKIPELVLEKSLDRETQNTYELILTAFDGGNPIQTGTALVRIFVTDSNDNFPVFSQELYKVILNEDTPINSIVLRLNATDKDEGSNAKISYNFSNIQENVLHTFSIDTNTGEIKTTEKLDFELIRIYEISVEAKDGGGLVSHSEIVIEIIDANDNTPEIIITSISNPILENSVPGTVVALINVHDQDTEENGEVDCEITDTYPFQLISSSGSYYKIVTMRALDREKLSCYNITIFATDKGTPPLSTSKVLRFEIADVNDNPPVFEKSAYVSYVPENNLPGASIFNIFASDIDNNENAQIVYSIYYTNMEEIPKSSYFSINSLTGTVYAQRSFDYEQHREFEIQIMAKDNGSPSLSSNTTLKICVEDQNDNAPKILYPLQGNDGSAVFEMVPFDAEQGSLVTKVVAVDEDSGHNAWLSYRFVQVPEKSNFIIGRHTGEIRTSRAFQEKDALRQRIVVMVKDNGYPSLSATVALSLVVAESFQQLIPIVSNQSNESDTQSSLQFYLVIALALISFLFVLTVLLAIVSNCKKTKSSAFNSLSTNIYSQVDPRFLSKYNNGTLPLPYSYDVCVALDSSESDFAFLKTTQNVPIASLIDADDSGIGNDNIKETLPTSNLMESELKMILTCYVIRKNCNCTGLSIF